jgi:PAS domain S-box-containing protein
MTNSLYCKIITDLNGSIVWCNKSFSNWVGYTQSEIVSKNLSNFSISEENFAETFDDLNIDINDYNTSSIVHRRFLKRNGAVEWGIFHFMKCPEINNEKNNYLLCSWEPSSTNEQILTKKILEKIEKMTEEISGMTKTIVKLTENIAKSCEPDEESRWFSYTIKMIQKYPKVSLLLVALILGSYGASNILDILSKLGFIHIGMPTP